MTDEKFDNLPTGLSPIANAPQPQIAQFEIQFAGPLTTDYMVDKVSDLLNLPLKYNYQHKRVWVKEKKTPYYLDNGDGSVIENWKPERSRTVINKWNQTHDYQEGDICYWSKKIVRARKDVPKGLSNPLDPAMEEYWEVICGETETLRLIFGVQTPASSVIINTEILNPLFEVLSCDIIKDAEGTPISDPVTGLVMIENAKKVYGFVIRRKDLDDETGYAYEIQFESDGVPYGISGVVNVK